MHTDEYVWTQSRKQPIRTDMRVWPAWSMSPAGERCQALGARVRRYVEEAKRHGRLVYPEVIDLMNASMLLGRDRRAIVERVGRALDEEGGVFDFSDAYAVWAQNVDAYVAKGIRLLDVLGIP